MLRKHDRNDIHTFNTIAHTQITINVFDYSSDSESVSITGVFLVVVGGLHCSMLLPEPLGPSNDSSFSLLLSLLNDVEDCLGER